MYFVHVTPVLKYYSPPHLLIFPYLLCADKKVQLRRPSLSNNELEPATPASALHVVEIHIDTNVRPTIYPELQFDQLPTDSGSAVQRLKQFLEIDGSVDVRSSTKMPAAVQPGKAFDSLKYFLSSMD